MAFLQIQHHSETLMKACSMYAILPKNSDKPYPVMYLLHGLSDDHTVWHRWTRIEWYVRNLHMSVVMPDGGRSFYCDAVDGPNYETYIMEDVINFIDTHFNTVSERSGRVIGGLSMGGYGAMKLALKFPDKFCSVVSHSGALGAGHKPLRSDLSDELRLIFGENPTGGKDDLYAIAEKADKTKLPAIRIDCGVDDFLIEDNRLYHRHLNDLSIKHEYEEFPGIHEWDFWNEHIQEAIAFHRKVMGSTC
ncbi:esterase family protein [Candidatus Poribacteria bacterium]|nr:esterase family protein [Candidatus Poribacteria bacterium]